MDSGGGEVKKGRSGNYGGEEKVQWSVYSQRQENYGVGKNGEEGESVEGKKQRRPLKPLREGYNFRGETGRKTEQK